jgi:putative transposase
VARVKAMAAETRSSDGRRRRAKPRQDDSLAVGRDHARRFMHQAAVTVRRPKRHPPVTTDRGHGDAVAPHVLARQFAVGQPNQVWLGDIPYVWTAEGWFSVAVLLDWYARTGVGWAMRSHVDAALVQEAWRMALGRRRPSAGLRHHADRGSQDAGQAYPRLLDAHDLHCRMSRKGDCRDHAVAERFFSSLKRERTAHGPYATRQETREEVIDDLEMFYNSRRKPSYLGYVRPNEYEAYVST